MVSYSTEPTKRQARVRPCTASAWIPQSSASLAMATPLVAGVAGLAAFGAMVGYRAAFRHALKKAREEIDKMLLALQQQLDS